MSGTMFDSILGRLREKDTGSGGTPVPAPGTWIVKGVILVNSDFPLPPPTVQPGRIYYVEADVIDDDPTRTNTGQVFLLGDIVVWNVANRKTIGNIYAIRDALALTYIKAEYNPGVLSGRISAQIPGNGLYQNTEILDFQVGNAIIQGQFAENLSNQAGGIVTIRGGTADGSAIGGYLVFNGGTSNNYGPGGFVFILGGDAGVNDDGFGNYSNGGSVYIKGGTSYGNALSGEILISGGDCDSIVGTSGGVGIGTFGGGTTSGDSGSISIGTGEAPGGTSGRVKISTGPNSLVREIVDINANRLHFSDNPLSEDAYELVYIDSESAEATSGDYPALNIVNTNEDQGDGDTTFNRSSIVASAAKNGVQVWMTAGYELPGTSNFGLEGGQIGMLTNHDLQFVRSVYSLNPLEYIRMIMGATYLELQRYGVNPGQTMELRFQDTTGVEYVALKAPDTIPTSYDVVLPPETPAENDILSVQSVSGSTAQTEWVSNISRVYYATGVDLLTAADTIIQVAIPGKKVVVKEITILITGEAGVGVTDPVVSVGTTGGVYSDFISSVTLTTPFLNQVINGFVYTGFFGDINTNDIGIRVNTAGTGWTQLDCTVIVDTYLL